jgi:SAM-dependent methyltransferase
MQRQGEDHSLSGQFRTYCRDAKLKRTAMTEITVPKRRFVILRRLVRTYTPGLYRKLLTSNVARRWFHYLRGEQKIFLQGDLANRFTQIYERKAWQVEESRSGGRSNIYATEKIRAAIPKTLEKYHIRSVLDVPCGDFFWFNEMQLPIEHYIGGDIVRPLIEENSKKFASATKSFRVIDITRDALPASDLLLCRNLFIHLSNNLVISALRNIADAELTYLLVTHDPDIVENIDIDPGMHRGVNLRIAPFNFPPPLEQLDDYTVASQFRQLALWRIADLRRLAVRRV